MGKAGSVNWQYFPHTDKTVSNACLVWKETWPKGSVCFYKMCISSQPWIEKKISKEKNWSVQTVRIKTHLDGSIIFGFWFWFISSVLQSLENTTYQTLSITEHQRTEQNMMFHITIRIPSAPNLLSIMSVIVTCVFDLWDLRVSTVQGCYSSGVSCFMPVS